MDAMFRQRNKRAVDSDDEGGSVEDRKRRGSSYSIAKVLGVLFVWLLTVFVAVEVLRADEPALPACRPHRPLESAGFSISALLPERQAASRSCSVEQAKRQGEYSPVARIRGCPSEDDAWLRFAQLLLPQAKVFIDIGSNKGYTAARFFELWNPELGLDSMGLHSALKSTTKERDLLECGACNDCMEVGVSLMPALPRFCSPAAESTSDPNMAHSLTKAVSGMCSERARSFDPIRVFSFDGNPVMVNGVTKARDFIADGDAGVSRLKGVADVPQARLPNDPKKKFLKQKWLIELAAFSDKYEPGKTVEFVLGIGEKGHLISGSEKPDEGSNENRAIVPVLTVDSFVERESIEHVDILKIDTEGHDPNVIRGATKTLKNHRATLVIFEYNTMWEEKERLRDVVGELLEDNGYACYLEGKNLLLKLTQGCWSEKLEMRKWSNVWCTSLQRTDGISLATVFDSYSVAFL